jgi:type I restriction-modification system DNA methylase subunit
MPTPTLRAKVQDQLHALRGNSDLFTTGNDFFGKALGYDTSLRSKLTDNSYAGFDRVYVQGDEAFDPAKALTDEWQTVEVLFQLTEEQMVKTIGIFGTEEVDKTIMESYIFVAIDLGGENYSRTKLAHITRQINQLFRQPVMLLFRYGASDVSPLPRTASGSREAKGAGGEGNADTLLTLAVIDRRLNKRDTDKDVLKKVTFIKDIKPAAPNRAHVDILSELHQEDIQYREPKGKRRKPRNFVELHRAWRQILSVTELNKRFYGELSDWFFWATGKGKNSEMAVDFQFDLIPASERDAARARAVIRLITRIIFVWFLKEKGLVPDKLFDDKDLKKEGIDFSKDESAYYKAILQNLFFATLNTKIDKRGVKDGDKFQGKTKEYGNPSLLRHTSLCTRGRAQMTELFATVPFLNGGLFECLDKREQNVWIDCFTEGKHQPTVPNQLFFAETNIDVDLNEVYGTKGRSSQVRGLFPILNSYKFTIDENTPVDEEVALDPELLGKVFENLLAAYNEETKDTARRQTGSFYTPREIVNYMVEEGLIAYLEDYVLQRVKPKPTGPKFKPLQLGLFGVNQAVQTEFDFDNPHTATEFRDKLRGNLRALVSFNQDKNPFHSSEETHFVVEAIDAIRILDPAVGSGAYPMGVLQLLVHTLAKIDPGNVYWRKVQEANAARTQVQGEDVGAVFSKHAEDNYFRKLYLIQNCIFGVDLQPIAIQICKLRFFVSLAIDEKKNDDREDNYGVKPLPNLETKFVAANSLVKLYTKQLGIVPVKALDLQEELARLRRRHFSLKSKAAKDKNRAKDEATRQEIGQILVDGGWPTEVAGKVAGWNPYDQSQSAGWFDPDWMLGQPAFDLVIGNPPYRQLQKYDKATKDSLKAQGYATHVNTGDIYSLFYERGVELLKQRGILAYITSNNWMRAKYGEATRKFFVKYNPLVLVDFGMAQMFESATTYTNILLLQKAKNEKETRMVRVRNDFDAEKTPLASYVNANASVQTRLDGNSWVAYTQTEYDLKRRVEKQGKALKDKSVWKIEINYGIKTGYNEAFIIDQAKRDELVAADAKGAEIIRPILRGRDIRAWVPSWEGWYLINTHNGIKAKNIPPVDVENDYPAIYAWFKIHEKQMAKRYDKGDHWSNLRNLAYLEEFDQPKIMYPNMTNSLPFIYDKEDHYFCNDKAFIITGENLAYLSSIFNSPLFRFFFKDNFPELLGNSYEVRATFFEKIPIKPPVPEQEWLFERLADYIITAKNTEGLGAAALFFQQLVNGLVYELYFEGELRKAGIILLPLLTEGVVPELPESGEAAVIESVYKTLHDPSHPVRVGLFKLDTVREVRIIEGKG